MKKNKFSLGNRFKSFRYAGEGLVSFFRQEHNTWIHLLATLAVTVLGFVTDLEEGEVLALIIVVALVWTMELMNTAIEKIMDFISVEKRKEIKYIKDLAASAVLVAALAAFITGCIIFIPKLF